MSRLIVKTSMPNNPMWQIYNICISMLVEYFSMRTVMNNKHRKCYRWVFVCKVIMANKLLIFSFPTIGIEVAFPVAYPTSCLLGHVDMVDCLSQEDYSEQVSPSGKDSSHTIIGTPP